MATASYLNTISAGRARYFLVELVRFTGDGFSAFEARTILKPTGQPPKASGPSINETTFLETIADTAYREALERLFDTSHGLGLRIEWGTRGPSIRVLTRYRTEPISVAWIYPPGVSGWMGLRDVTFGYDCTQTKAAEQAQPAFADYELAISQIAGGSEDQREGPDGA